MKRRGGGWLTVWVLVLAPACGAEDSSGGRENTRALCSDDVDNDGDGHVDCGDQDCVDLAACIAGGDGDADSDGDSDADGDADGEQCNGLDDDGDGQVDEGSPGSGVACLTGLQGPCSDGLTGCAAGAIDCYPNVNPVAESCANPAEDNDCNGELDDVDGFGADCVTGLGGACAAGSQTCVQGALVCAPANTGVEGSCPNGIDDDCNGEVDDGDGASAETCGNMGGDDDCNGVVDDVPGLGDWCFSGLENRCAEGAFACADGEMMCDSLTDPIEERCDNEIDEDCDGEVDEAGCLDPNLHHTGYGYEWTDDALAGTYSVSRAVITCTWHMFDAGLEDQCADGCVCGDELLGEERSFGAGNANWEGGPQWCWFYEGPLRGLTAPMDDACNAEDPNTWD